jgi:hypothetical protein
VAISPTEKEIVIPAETGIHLCLNAANFGVLTSLFCKEGQAGDFAYVIPAEAGIHLCLNAANFGVLTSLFCKACPEPAEGRDKREILPASFQRKLESRWGGEGLDTCLPVEASA